MKLISTTVLSTCLSFACGLAAAAEDAMKITETMPTAAMKQKAPSLRECRALKKAGAPKDDASMQKQAQCNDMAKKRDANMTKAAPVDPTKR